MRLTEHINVYAVTATDKCSQETKRQAVALSDSQIRMARRLGVSTERLISRFCAQAGLTAPHIGEMERIEISPPTGVGGDNMRDEDDVHCPLCLHVLDDPPLLCAMDICDAYSTTCYSILSAAEAVLEEEQPP